MERSNVLRMLLIAGGMIVFFMWGLPALTGSNHKVQVIPTEAYVNGPGFTPDKVDPPAKPGTANPAPVEGEICKIQGDRFDAELSTRGAAITHFFLHDAQYGAGFDLSSTPAHERWRSLRTQFRSPEANDQLAFDRVVWKLDAQDGKSCTFSYEDADARIVKKVAASSRPFELAIETTLTNLASTPRKHQFSIGIHAYRKNADMKGSLGRQAPFQTEVSCAGGKDVVRKAKGDFQSGWIGVPGVDRYAAVNSHYFSQAIVPEPAEGAVTDLPRCEILAEDWVLPGQASDADDAATVFHAKLVYPPKDIAPHASLTYRETSFFGPKERPVLAKAAGGHPQLTDVTNLGFFTPVARVLTGVLVFLHDKVTFGNWGVAIILMTVCLRTLLFPLTFKSIKTTVAMRRLKPEVDALNAKFADDAQAKNLAMMELWKKHGVNPLGGCLPQLVQMPVWFAMYTTLQTAVQMYHTKFLWFSDLSAPDELFKITSSIHFGPLPLLLGVFMIVQQRIVPQQGMDPVQQKMMMYMLPAVFTGMMLFLPAALGVYMLTNSVLGIVQQLIVEQIAPSGKGPKEIVVKQKGEKDSGKPSNGGNLRLRKG